MAIHARIERFLSHRNPSGMFWFFSRTHGAQRRFVPEEFRTRELYFVMPDIEKCIEVYKLDRSLDLLRVTKLTYRRRLVKLSPPSLRAMRTRAGADDLTPQEFRKLKADIAVCEDFPCYALYPVTTWVFYQHVQ